MSNNSINCNRPAEVACGGTGVATVTTGALLLGAGTSALTELGPLTKGDLLVGDGSGAPTELSVGTDGFVVVADSAEGSGVKWVNPNTLAGDGSLIYLTNATAASSSEITFNSTYITSTYEHYLLVIRMMNVETDRDNLNMQISTDNGSTWLSSSYDYISQKKFTSDSTSEDSQFRLTFNGTWGIGTATGEGRLNGRIFLNNPTNASTFTGIQGDLYWQDALGSDVAAGTHGSYAVASAVNAIRIYCDSGDMADGEFILYGHKES